MWGTARTQSASTEQGARYERYKRTRQKALEARRQRASEATNGNRVVESTGAGKVDGGDDDQGAEGVRCDSRGIKG